jgi:hypothetical protein
MVTLGVILMVVGFVTGIYGGLTMSRREVMTHSNGEINKSKQMQLSIISGAAAITMIVGIMLYYQVF